MTLEADMPIQISSRRYTCSGGELFKVMDAPGWPGALLYIYLDFHTALIFLYIYKYFVGKDCK